MHQIYICRISVFNVECNPSRIVNTVNKLEEIFMHFSLCVFVYPPISALEREGIDAEGQALRRKDA